MAFVCPMWREVRDLIGALIQCELFPRPNRATPCRECGGGAHTSIRLSILGILCQMAMGLFDKGKVFFVEAEFASVLLERTVTGARLLNPR